MTTVDDTSWQTLGSVSQDTLASGAVPTNTVMAAVGWLSAFEPSAASLAELAHAREVLARVRAFADGLSVRVDAALAATVPAANGSSPRPRLVPEGPVSGTAAERKRRRDAAMGASRVSALAVALTAGDVSLDHVAALGRVRNAEAVAAREDEVLAAAKIRSAEDFARWLQLVDDLVDVDNGVDLEGRRRARRGLSFFDAELGMGGLRVVFDPLAHASVRDAIFRMADTLWHQGDRSATPAQRYADALVELIARGAGVRTTQRAGVGDIAGDGPSDASTTATKRPRRPTMMVLIDEASLYGRLHAAGIATTVDGVTITAGEARRLACSADLLPVVLGGDGRVLDIGRTGRYATDAQWAALVAQDGGCVLADCTAPASWCEAHHLHEWENNGPTNLGNLCLLCATHHRMVHTNRWTVQRHGAHVSIVDSSGNPIPTRNRNGPKPPTTEPP